MKVKSNAYRICLGNLFADPVSLH